MSDEDEVRKFQEFLSVAGPMVRRDDNGKVISEGPGPIKRFIDAGRLDLIDYALPGAPGEEAFWSVNDDDLNITGNPPYDITKVGGKILSTVDPLRLLDLGCGFGRLTNAIARTVGGYGVVHGVDVSAPNVKRAVVGAPGNAKYWHGDGRQLPSGLNGKFSGAYSIAMFQHIPHDAMWGYLRAVHDRLERGGVFLFTVAVGEIDEFLNHQITDIQQFGADLWNVYENITIEADDVTGWTWVTARKEA